MSQNNYSDCIIAKSTRDLESAGLRMMKLTIRGDSKEKEGRGVKDESLVSTLSKWTIVVPAHKLRKHKCHFRFGGMIMNKVLYILSLRGCGIS